MTENFSFLIDNELSYPEMLQKLNSSIPKDYCLAEPKSDILLHFLKNNVQSKQFRQPRNALILFLSLGKILRDRKFFRQCNKRITSHKDWDETLNYFLKMILSDVSDKTFFNEKEYEDCMKVH